MANMITVGGTVLPAPSELKVDIMDINNADRNTRGTIIIERIATKRKLEVGYKHLSAAQLSTVLTAISSTFFSVTYRDPQTNADRTATFYSGDRTAGVMDFIDGVARYTDVKFNLIEK